MRLSPRIVASGGWVVFLAILFATGAVMWRVLDAVRGPAQRAVGDGTRVVSYGFDLNPCLVPSSAIVAAGIPRDGVRALTDPGLLDRQISGKGRGPYRKLLLPGDRVIGVAVNGSARAYPIRVLNWHEIVNDTLGGRPIAVTYSPLCDAAVVFDPVVGMDTLRFGVSGLLYNSNLLMYNKEVGRVGESLWCQLMARAIAGPAAALDRRLTVLPASVVRWEDWRLMHPGTTVVAPDPSMAAEYRRDPYSSYFGSDRLRFPVDPLPPADERVRLKTPVVALGAGGPPVVFPISLVSALAGPDGAWVWELNGRTFRFLCRGDPPTVAVEAEDSGQPYEVVYSFWFAYYASHPGQALFSPEEAFRGDSGEENKQ